MAIHLNPYLSFRGNAREAMTFYHSVFGGELRSMTLGEMHATEDPSEFEWIMHAQLETPNGLILQGSDTPKVMELTPGDNVAVSLFGDDNAELGRYFDALSEGGSVTVPFEVAPWGDRFGMFVDPFGINWLVNGTAD